MQQYPYPWRKEGSLTLRGEGTPKSIIVSLEKADFSIVLTDGLTKEHCIAVALFCKSVYKMYRTSGALFVALYFK